MADGPTTGRRFIDIAMPDQFVLQTRDAGDAQGRRQDGWIDWGLYRAADFGRDEDGTYVSSTGGGSPLFLRCTSQEGDVIHVVDGAGGEHVYRLVPYPGERYS